MPHHPGRHRQSHHVRVAATLLAASAALMTSTVIVDAASATAQAPSTISQSPSFHACSDTPLPGHAACFAQIITESTRAARTSVTVKPAGYGPADLRSAYRLSSTAGRGRTVAIVDAFDDPTAEHDLAVYRKEFGLPACTHVTGCFTKLKLKDKAGHAARSNPGWATEISLDVDMVSATCPACKILLVEAGSDSVVDLAHAVDVAASRHVTAISNSYGFSDVKQFASYDHPGIAITASTGDSGFRVAAPASFPSVVAVGGTSLTRAHTARGWKETAWRGAGSGCSHVNDKPAWQTSVTRCAGKTAADVAAVADPKTGVAVYDSTSFHGLHGWGVFGGTSTSAPIIAAVYAMAGPLSSYPASWTWAHRSKLNDVTGGTNGTCATRQWCTSGAGWDGPTGLGTPNGTAAF